MSKLKLLLDSYHKRLQPYSVQSNIAAFRAICLIDELKKTFNNQSPDYATVYDNTFYSHSVLFGGGSFKITSVTELSLGCNLLLSELLKLLKHYPKKGLQQKTIELIDFLYLYQVQSLEPGLAVYSDKLLTIKDQATAKEGLSSLFKNLIDLTQNEIHQFKQQEIKRQLGQAEQATGATQYLSRQFIRHAKEAISYHLADLTDDPQFSFLAELQKLTQKNILNYRDIAQLKQSALLFEQSVLKLKPINEIHRFHWILNLICNLLNAFGNFVESQKSQQVKQEFKLFNQWLDTAERAEKKVDSYMQQAIAK